MTNDQTPELNVVRAHAWVETTGRSHPIIPPVLIIGSPRGTPTQTAPAEPIYRTHLHLIAEWHASEAEKPQAAENARVLITSLVYAPVRMALHKIQRDLYFAQGKSDGVFGDQQALQDARVAITALIEELR